MTFLFYLIETVSVWVKKLDARSFLVNFASKEAYRKFIESCFTYFRLGDYIDDFCLKEDDYNTCIHDYPFLPYIALCLKYHVGALEKGHHFHI